MSLHHIELWVADLAAAERSWGWLLPALDWRLDADAGWERGRIWRHGEVYLVIERSPAVLDAPHQRRRPGLNHLAFTIADVEALDRLRAAAAGNGWSELFADAYPHAGGPQHTALYLEDTQGFEVEIVAPSP